MNDFGVSAAIPHIFGISLACVRLIYLQLFASAHPPIAGADNREREKTPSGPSAREFLNAGAARGSALPARRTCNSACVRVTGANACARFLQRPSLRPVGYSA
ncbi:hypothetical protein MRX96_030835 [Rhipicephalus microplus]